MATPIAHMFALYNIILQFARQNILYRNVRTISKAQRFHAIPAIFFECEIWTIKFGAGANEPRHSDHLPMESLIQWFHREFFYPDYVPYAFCVHDLWAVLLQLICFIWVLLFVKSFLLLALSMYPAGSTVFQQTNFGISGSSHPCSTRAVFHILCNY